MIRLFDSVLGDVRELELRDPGRISMYVCGPTVYDLPHLGHGRLTLVWDVARRWYTFRGYVVDYVSNVTDIDDNIIKRALKEATTEPQVAARFEQEWWDAMDLLGVARPSQVPHATRYVEDMVELVSSFLDQDIGYTTSDGVYFDVSRVADYGLLAGQPLDSLRSGARVEANDEKRSPLDFAIWKFAKPGEPRWPAPFGDGRPGWHTECVVMSLDLLGEGFDLHVGGLDLRFPHHENERAQAVAAGRDFTHHWSHSGWVMVGDEKMSKSLGNFTSLTDMLGQADPRAYRLLVLRSHYRSPIEVTTDTIADAQRALVRLDALARRFDLPELAGDAMVIGSDYNWSGLAGALYEGVALVLDDDLNTPLAVAQLFEAVSAANAAGDRGDDAVAHELAGAVAVLFGALGLTLRASADAADGDTQDLVGARDLARAREDWAEADRLRAALEERGWVVEDSASGTLIRRP
ncbi:MAG: cysteine--tRNA ligase [Acidimicrobiales bacterium]